MTARGRTDPAPLLRVRDVSHSYGAGPVLEHVDLTVGPGAFTGIVGPSGSGKTTLLRVLLGTTRPVAGSVARRAGVRVGYVPQVDAVDWSFPVTVDQCVRMARTGRRRPWPDRDERREAAAVLERLGLGGLAGRHIRELSGGQQQRMFVARALLGRPDVLVLDEPTSGVDVHTRHEVLHLLGELHADGLAVVLSTHDLNGVAAHLPDVLCLNRRVVARGAPAQVFTPAVLEATFGARLEVLVHAGVPVVLDAPLLPHGRRAGTQAAR